MTGIIVKGTPKVHIVIPDSHARPGFNNDRYDWLGKLIVDVKPDVVVDIGDWYDMESLSSYDKGKKSFEGRRYVKDIAVGVEAQEKLLAPVLKQKQKLPRFVRTLGNHENRINKAINLEPHLDGLMGTKDFQSKEYRWEEIEFNTPIEIDGIFYCHHFPSGAMGKPIGGENIGRMLLQKKHVSCTQGHSHLLDYSIRTGLGGQKMHGLSVGCYFDYEMDYAGPCNELYDRGVVIKTEVCNGNYDFRWVSIEALKKEYGS
jgi:hypothetical protein